jgi:hypothetical protein
MSVVWSVEPEKKLMTAVATGEVTRADLVAFFEETTAARVAPYRKLFDGRASETKMGPDDMLALGVLAQSLHQPGGEMGPLALVLPMSMMELVRRLAGILAVADRPMRVFTDIDEARAWLDNPVGAAKKERRRPAGPGKPEKLP